MSRRARTPRQAALGARIAIVFVALGALLGAGLQPAAAAEPVAEASAPLAIPAAVEVAAGDVVKMANLANFRPGNIIGDAVFFNRSSMTEAQIQTFLNGKVPTCASGYTCLKTYRDTSRTIAADPMCGAYAGSASESAARIIYKVAQACGINPQVLLVTLQKEQGLVTSTAPSATRYRAAMGQGCPDTAACDTAYYGFFNQVYGAARQFKRYANPPGTSQYFTWYAPGNTWNVLYHPNRACGTSPVYIENQATANLYYYTPYRPNAAALNAGYGLGNSCSSYGNRNFYNYFTDWFGSTQYLVTGAMATAWNARGGANGQLGHPTGPARWLTAGGGGYKQQFQSGAIWQPNGSATAFSIGAGPFYSNYAAVKAESGAWGWPKENPRCGLAEGGCAMKTSTGTVYYSTATASQLVLPQAAAFYESAGGPAGAYGYPSAALRRGPDASYEQQFETGHVVYQAKSGVVALAPTTLAAWRAQGGLTGRLAYPLAQTASLAGNGGGRVQEFKGGTIFDSAAGAYTLGLGPFRTNYIAAGGAGGAWGWPTGAAACGQVDGGCLMPTQRGTIAYSAATGSRLVPTAGATTWIGKGGPSWLGYPTGAATAAGAGTVQVFTKGRIYTAGVAVAISNGPLGAGYLALGGPTGAAGYPTAAAVCGKVGGGCLLPVANGTVAYSSATGTRLVASPILAAWQQRGAEAGALGYPIAAAATSGTVTSQRFQRGTISVDSATGVVTVG